MGRCLLTPDEVATIGLASIEPANEPTCITGSSGPGKTLRTLALLSELKEKGTVAVVIKLSPNYVDAMREATQRLKDGW